MAQSLSDQHVDGVEFHSGRVSGSGSDDHGTEEEGRQLRTLAQCDEHGRDMA